PFRTWGGARRGDKIRTLRCVTSDKPTGDLHRVHAGRRTCTADRACPDSTDCSTATPPCSQAGTSWHWPRRRLRARDRRRTRLRSDRCCYTSTWFARARRIGCKHRPTQGSEPSSFFQARETCGNCVASGAALPLLYQPQWYTTLLLSDALSGTAADRSYPACTFPENAEVRRVTRRQEPEHAILSAIAIALQASDHYDSDLPARAALRSSSNADRLAFAPECPRSMNSLGAVHPRVAAATPSECSCAAPS